MPPDRLCHLCHSRMPAHESFEACLRCKSQRAKIESILTEIHRTFPETAKLELEEILQRLWKFRWDNRRIAGLS